MAAALAVDLKHWWLLYGG